MSTVLLDGKALAETVRAEVRAGVTAFEAQYGRVPGLDVVLVGSDPASEVYTRNKEKAANEVGMRGRLHRLPATMSEAEVMVLLARLRKDDSVDGILVQLPLPAEVMQASTVLAVVPPEKDVDGFHPLNVGLLALGTPALVPCTPLACMRLLRASKVTLEGAHAVIVGRSNIVGKPLAQLLLAQNATVTIAHSRTRDLPDVCRTADVLVAAVGKPQMIRGDWVGPGAVVIDVGINRIDAGGGKTRLVGDVAFDEAQIHAAAITPVPGGVGPMTIACLLENTLRAATAREDARRRG